MAKKPKKTRGNISKLFFPESRNRTEFTDNRHRFRLFNKFDNQPPAIAFMLGTMGAVCFTVVPFFIKDTYYSTLSIILLVLGFCITVIFEWGANLHYRSYSKIANDKNYDSVIANIRINYTLRTIAMLGWVVSVLAITLILTKNSDLISLFAK